MRAIRRDGRGIGGADGRARRHRDRRVRPVQRNQIINKHTLSGNRLINHSISGTQIELSTLGKVPSAHNADSATNAGHATNSDRLGGSPPRAFHDRCPAEIALKAPDLCAMTSDTAGSGEPWHDALRECAALGMRLPSPAEAFLMGVTSGAYWTDDFYLNGSTASAPRYRSDLRDLEGDAEANSDRVRCVTTPANS